MNLSKLCNSNLWIHRKNSYRNLKFNRSHFILSSTNMRVIRILQWHQRIKQSPRCLLSLCIISLSSVQVVSWRTRSTCHCLHLAQRLASRERGCLWQRADSMRLLVVPVTWMRTSDASPDVVLPDQLISRDSLFGGEIDWLLLSAVRSICELELLISLWQFKEASLLLSLLKLRRTLSRISLLATSSRLHASR